MTKQLQVTPISEIVEPANTPIGIFDSGVGGLTVLAKVQQALPGESIIYVGDTANAPYGGKSYDELLQHARDIINFLRGQGVKAVVLACGTTSSTVYRQLVKEYPDIPLIDVIRPGVNACVELASQNPDLRIGLIATAATVNSGLFAKLLTDEKPDTSLLTQACPLFAPMVEAGVTHGLIAKWAVEAYIDSWRGNVDALVLGCTHYPLLSGTLSSVLGADVQLIDMATHATQALKAQLIAVGCLHDGDSLPYSKFYVSGNPDNFNKTARFILNREVNAQRLYQDYGGQT